MNTKNNQRFQDTEKRLEETFLSLCQTTPAEKITVSQICKAVPINRSTFYDHYLDVPDLINRIGIKYMGEMFALNSQEEEAASFPLTEDYLIRLFSYIEKNRIFFDIFFNHSSPSSVENGFSRFLETACEPYMERIHLKNKEAMQYHFTFFKAGFIAVLSQWVQHGCKETSKEIAEILLRNLPKSDLMLY